MTVECDRVGGVNLAQGVCDTEVPPPVVQRAIQAIREVLAGSLNVNIDLSIGVPDTVWPVRVDKSELELALVNLTVNARDAMPNGGRLSITGDNVLLLVEDTPEGLSAVTSAGRSQ